MIESPASKSFVPRATAEEERNAPPRARSASPLVWLNLVCLDAPLVALTWELLFAKSFGIRVANGGTAALFFTAWLIYLADRFGDSMSLRAETVMSLRQQFCLGHRFLWLGAIALIACADLLVVASWLEPRASFVGALIGAAALVYLAVNRFRPTLWRLLPLK